MADAAHLIDVDLHVESRRSLGALHAALPMAQPRDVVNLVDSLPRTARRCWNEATVRTFDIGIQAGPEVEESKGLRAFDDVTLAPETLRAVIRVKARIQVTVYPPRRD